MQQFNPKQFFTENNISLTDTQLEQLEIYAGLLVEWNQKMNLTSIVEPHEIYEKHYLDSLLPTTYFPYVGRLVDVGTGAGFPGLVLAIYKPDLEITLLEPIKKRCVFLSEVTKKLGLNNVKIENSRAEDYAEIHREIFDIATARAVANLSILSELCIPLVKENGKFIAMKGTNGAAEAAEAEHAFESLGCKKPEVIAYALPSAGHRTLIIGSKIKKTSATYPRAYAQMKKHPL